MCSALFKIPNIAILPSFFMKTAFLPSVLLLLSGKKLPPDSRNMLELLFVLFLKKLSSLLGKVDIFNNLGDSILRTQEKNTLTSSLCKGTV